MKMSWKLMVDDFIYHFPVSIYVEVVEYVIIKYSYVISTFWNAFDPPSAKQKLLSLLDMWNLVVQKLIGHVSKVSWLTIESMPISFSFPMYLYKRVKKEKKTIQRCVWLFWIIEHVWEDFRVWIFFIVL